VSDRERELLDACALFALVMARAHAEFAALTADNKALRDENKELRNERDQFRLAAQSNHDIVVDLVKRYDEERHCIDVEPDPGCLECTSGTTPNDHNTGICALHRATGVTP
jgi:hypothetical protein